MRARSYSVAEAQRDFEKLLLEAGQGVEVYIVDDEKRVVELVPFERDNKRRLADQEQI